MNLQPRSKPVEENAKPKPEQQQQAPRANIFGSAKPVDTAQREREIEERMRKQRETPSTQNKSSLESRGYGASRGYDEAPRATDRRPNESDKENRYVYVMFVCETNNNILAANLNEIDIPFFLCVETNKEGIKLFKINNLRYFLLNVILHAEQIENCGECQN